MRQEAFLQTDRLFAALLLLEWLVAIAVALFVSPPALISRGGPSDDHVWAALFLGGTIIAIPVYLAILAPGRKLTRHVIAICQILMGALLIHFRVAESKTNSTSLVRSLYWPSITIGQLFSRPRLSPYSNKSFEAHPRLFRSIAH